MKMSVCLDALWPRLPCEDAVTLATGSGATAIEFWGWWDKDLPAVKKACFDTAWLSRPSAPGFIAWWTALSRKHT